MKSHLLFPFYIITSQAVRESISNKPDTASGVCLSSQLLAAHEPLPICTTRHATVATDKQQFSSEKVLGGAEDAGSNPWSQTPTNCYHNSTLNSDFCVYTSSRVANGKGTAIITDNLRAAHLARAVALLADATDDPLVHAGSHKPINVQNAKYKIVPIPGKDLGAVATERIVRGEIILQETGDAVRGLPARHRDRFMDMSPGAHGGDVGFDELVERVMATNSFDVDTDDGVRDDEFFAAFVESEELTLSYIDPLQARDARRARLRANWGFDCTCPICTLPHPHTVASDERIAQIASLRAELADYRASSRATPAMAELLVSLYEQERVWGTLAEGYTLAAIEWNGVGDAWAATRYARLAIEHGIASQWEGHGDVVQMKMLAEDPWGHWSWMLRTRKRMGWGQGRAGEGDDEDEESDEE
ncbi:NAP1-binding protein 2 [Verticillium dahliae VDG1]|nr:NAP1-binding protein 2 [Verticillium dahliae VDG1]